MQVVFSLGMTGWPPTRRIAAAHERPPPCWFQPGSPGAGAPGAPFNTQGPVTIGATPQTLVHPAFVSPGAPGTPPSPPGTCALAPSFLVDLHESRRDPPNQRSGRGLTLTGWQKTSLQWPQAPAPPERPCLVVLQEKLGGSVGRDRELVLEPDVGPLTGVPELVGVVRLEVFGLERLSNVVTDEDEGLGVLFAGDRIGSVLGLDGVIKLPGSEMGAAVEDPSNVVRAVQLELYGLLLGVVGVARAVAKGVVTFSRLQVQFLNSKAPDPSSRW
ncbi:hypothetical protein BDK51DRAFT_42898 [Blyttiomyces helicus]|uniref:Uncharacterized protein n=1 Tax=Blyttiomyces helicus TaxID=388810 RepID=A0A4P9WH69_9FUNG|nr:hypothetical protein BDK51DRAFT_42898 [Blyttiomyces helicus]|eukprot:RKO92171.1 hypothetical protein BDK51DRAFT_42898 [Blyttiomyces helicus]